MRRAALFEEQTVALQQSEGGSEDDEEEEDEGSEEQEIEAGGDLCQWQLPPKKRQRMADGLMALTSPRDKLNAEEERDSEGAVRTVCSRSP